MALTQMALSCGEIFLSGAAVRGDRGGSSVSFLRISRKLRPDMKLCPVRTSKRMTPMLKISERSSTLPVSTACSGDM